MANFYLFSETAQQFFRQGELAEEFALYLEACPVCDSRQSKKLFDHDGFHYFTCKSCSFVYTNPRLNEAGSKIWYNSPYYNAALAREIYTNQKEETYYSASLEPLHLKELTDLVRDNFDRTAKIIDVGCSTGSILAFLKNELGFTNLKGIDLNEKAVEFARKNRGLDVELMDITNINQRGDYFDLVINTENIEHVNKLEDYILNISALLNEGGYLLISTPHNDEKAVKLLGLFGDHFCAPNHINYFNQKTITLFLEKYNFEVSRIKLYENNSFNLYSFIKSKFFVPDQVSADPPYEAYFSRPLFKNEKNRRQFVRLRSIAEEQEMEQDTIQSSNKSLSGKVKHLLQRPLGLTFKTHMLVLAQKKKQGASDQ